MAKNFYEVSGTEWADYLSTTMFLALKNVKQSQTLNVNDEKMCSLGLYIKPKSYTCEELNIHHVTRRALYMRSLIYLDTKGNVTLTSYGETVLNEINVALGDE